MTFEPQPWRKAHALALTSELDALGFWLAATADLIELLVACERFRRQTSGVELVAELRPLVARVRSTLNESADELERLTLDGALVAEARKATKPAARKARA